MAISQERSNFMNKKEYLEDLSLRLKEFVGGKLFINVS